MVVALGTSWRNSSSRFAPSSPVKKLTPVTLPPGRLRLATRPSLTGSPPVAKTIGTVVVAALAASAASGVADDHGHRPANQVGHQGRQPIGLIFRLAKFDRDVLALDEAGFLQALAECRHEIASTSAGDALRRKPTTGIACCCARAASGHAAAPPSATIKSRRLMCLYGLRHVPWLDTSSQRVIGL